MKRNTLLVVVGLLVAALFVMLQILFTVREGEVAVVTTFGKPQRALTEAGLYRRWPWPVQRVYAFDNRTHVLEGPLEETLTKDGKNILVALYAGWRIAAPVAFLERVGTPDQAARHLEGLLRNYKNAVLGQYEFAHLVNVDPAAIRFETIEDQIFQAVAPDAQERYGITLQYVGIRKIGLPDAITEKVFQRMRAERNQLAERYRSEGEGEAIKIRAQADSERDQILAKAEAAAERVRAEGDAQAAQSYRAFAQNPGLAMFLRKLKVLEDSLQEKATVVISTETEPFDLLRGDEALPKP